MEKKIKKFIFVGPESTGKTTLCKFLSTKYSTPWVPEMCRLFAEEKISNINTNIISTDINFNFNIDDFINMAHHQNYRENLLTQEANDILICDNDTFALTIWCERYLGKYYDEIFDIYKNADFLKNENKIYILTKPNVPFIQDGLRDGEHIRDWMFNRFLEEFKNKNIKYFIIDSPNYNDRYLQAIQIIDENLI
jgi:HTH-type transcriptional repressor of NAD biosynthesis genes